MVTPVPSGVTVTPAKRLLEPTGSGVEPFTVVVERGAAGKLWMRQLNREGHGVADIGGPVVVAEADGSTSRPATEVVRHASPDHTSWNSFSEPSRRAKPPRGGRLFATMTPCRLPPLSRPVVLW